MEGEIRVVKVTVTSERKQVAQESDYVAVIALMGQRPSLKMRAICDGDFRLNATPYALGCAVRRFLEEGSADEVMLHIAQSEFVRGYLGDGENEEEPNGTNQDQ